MRLTDYGIAIVRGAFPKFWRVTHNSSDIAHIVARDDYYELTCAFLMSTAAIGKSARFQQFPTTEQVINHLLDIEVLSK